MEQHEVFSTIVQSKNVPNNIAQTAQQLLQTWGCRRNTETEVDLASYAVCALFTASVIHRNEKSQESSQVVGIPTLSDLLDTGNVHIKRFFERMGRLQSDHSFHQSVKPALKATMQKYCVTSALYHKFQQLMKRIFIQDPDSPLASEVASSEVNQGQPNRKHICWTLFLLAKGSLQQAANELVMTLHLLICCIEYTVKLSPAFLLQEPFNSAHYSQETEDAILQALCEEMGCRDDMADVVSVGEACLVPILSAIPRERLNQGLEGLPELEFLQEQYDHIYRQAGDIDERLFLDSSSHLFVQKAPTSEPPSRPDTENEHSSTTAMTPVKRAINSVQSLKSLLSTASDAPSSPLTKYFKNCSQDPSVSINQRVVALKDAYVHHFKRVMGSPSAAVARSRFQIGVRLYYRVMEAMLRREEERLSTKDFSSLLLSDPFHKSLLACALEVVNVTYEYSPNEFSSMPGNASRLLFPWILNVFSLKAYDFGKVLESFVKDEPKLTQEAKKHLQSIETRIVESMAWQATSPLHDLIKTAGTTLHIASPGSISTRTNGLNAPRTTAADMYLSPIRPTPQAPNSSEATPPPTTLTSPLARPPQQPQGVGPYPSPQPSNIPMSPRKTRSVSLNMFLNKVQQLAYSRLDRLCGMLTVSKDLMKFIWTCVEYCVTNKTELLKNRHLDQIVMSCIYAICKVTENELKFKDIVNAYRSLPHAEATTYRNVDIDGTKEDSIIMFYNKVFMPVMKGYILQFQPKNQQTPTASPVPSRSSAVSQASPGFMVGPNLYISPMKESPFKSPHPVKEFSFGSPSQLTPRKRTHYSFGEGPGSSEKLREINERMKQASMDSGSNTRSSTSKRLKFEDEDVSTSSTSQDEIDCPITNGSSSSNGVSSTNGHMTSQSASDEPMSTQPLPPSMQRRVAMMTSDIQASLSPAESDDKK
ncbi:retinoblastoma-associated protein-like isoform X2 [Patiria miniata]|nr:retinoblastoma-associated protein-like isoform X2 [Patiria miniata]XP_038051163.1 retinoblastoma-associated protein-like isoform X2 [Patiria miniata]XP_038051164.1 retinoblastoma-associated protein-like isoform X2 [Patiria miniata]